MFLRLSQGVHFPVLFALYDHLFVFSSFLEHCVFPFRDGELPRTSLFRIAWRHRNSNGANANGRAATPCLISARWLMPINVRCFLFRGWSSIANKKRHYRLQETHSAVFWRAFLNCIFYIGFQFHVSHFLALSFGLFYVAWLIVSFELIHVISAFDAWHETWHLSALRRYSSAFWRVVFSRPLFANTREYFFSCCLSVKASGMHVRIM